MCACAVVVLRVCLRCVCCCHACVRALLVRVLRVALVALQHLDGMLLPLPCAAVVQLRCMELCTSCCRVADHRPLPRILCVHAPARRLVGPPARPPWQLQRSVAARQLLRDQRTVGRHQLHAPARLRRFRRVDVRPRARVGRDYAAVRACASAQVRWWKVSLNLLAREPGSRAIHVVTRLYFTKCPRGARRNYNRPARVSAQLMCATPPKGRTCLFCGQCLLLFSGMSSSIR